MIKRADFVHEVSTEQQAWKLELVQAICQSELPQREQIVLGQMVLSAGFVRDGEHAGALVLHQRQAAFAFAVGFSLPTIRKVWKVLDDAGHIVIFQRAYGNKPVIIGINYSDFISRPPF